MLRNRKPRSRRPAQSRRKGKRGNFGGDSFNVGISQRVQTKRITETTMPDRTIVPLKWSAVVGITDPDTLVDEIFSGNSAFDPGAGLTATQPSAFNYWSGFYGHYRVLGSKVKARLFPVTNQAELHKGQYGMVLYPSNTVGAVGSWTDAIVQPFAKMAQGTTDRPCPVLRNQMTTGRISGQRNLEGADRLQALISTNPSDEWYWHLVIWDNVTGTSVQCQAYIEVVYDIEFFDRSPLGNDSLLERLEKAEKNRLGMRWFKGESVTAQAKESRKNLLAEKKRLEEKDLELKKQVMQTLDCKDHGIEPDLATLKTQLDEYVVLKQKFLPPSNPPTPSFRPSERKVNSMK